ncbi:MAG: hypothetical protein Q7I97_04005 [Thermovirgaceae bacterium]|nr:hypothetical protein [Thermovirgaceae bacterium]
MRFEANSRFFIIAGSVLVLLFFLGLARDLLLERNVAPAGREAPAIVIEGLDVVRDVEGDRWTVKAKRVVKRGDISDAETLDVVIESPDGTVWTVRSDRGKIFEAEENIHLESAVGRVKHSGGEFDWTAPRANWDQKKSVWKFPEGFEARDEKLIVSGTKGGMTMAGVLNVEEGAVVTWKEPAR